MSDSISILSKINCLSLFLLLVLKSVLGTHKINTIYMYIRTLDQTMPVSRVAFSEVQFPKINTKHIINHCLLCIYMQAFSGQIFIFLKEIPIKINKSCWKNFLWNTYNLQLKCFQWKIQISIGIRFNPLKKTYLSNLSMKKVHCIRDKIPLGSIDNQRGFSITCQVRNILIERWLYILTAMVMQHIFVSTGNLCLGRVEKRHHSVFY